MSRASVLGIDIGTTNAKLVALDDAGRVIARSSVRYDISASANCVVTQDPSDLWKGMEKCIAEAARECSLDSVQALSLSTQGETLTCCDRHGNALAPAISWMDMRSGEEMRELASLRRDWHSKTGKPIAAYSTLAKWRWLEKHDPALFEATERFCQVADYLVWRLTGNWILDISNASFTSMFDVRARTWHAEICDEFGLTKRLPGIAESGSPAGTLLPELAKRWRMSPETKVILGGHDQACAALGAAPPDEACVMLSTGTAWALYTVSDAPRFHPRELGIIYCHAMPNRWAALTAHSGGCVLDAFLRQFCNAGDNPDYASHVRKENLCEDLIVIPYMFGANSPENDPAARAAILNLGAHHTPGNVAMAIIESIGFETRRNLDVLAEMDIAFDAVKMAGGACRSDVWPQIVADICNIRVDVIENADTAPLGAAFLAGRAMRLWKQDRLPEYPAMRAFTPETERSKKLDKKFRRYMNAVDLERQRRRNDGQETS